MAYPPRPSRRTSFTQANNAGQALSVANLDAEHNDFVEQIDQLNTFVRGVTTAAGTLKNLATATAQALAGSQRFVATASQTIFTTTIAYVAAFNNLNCEVFSQGVNVDPNLVTVANSGGFLRVTIPAQTLNAVVVVAAFESGAGILTRLINTASAADGANIIGVQDVGAIIAATTVEGALAEIVTNLNAYIANVGTVANLFKADGTVTATGNFNLGTRKITNMSPGTASTDAATYGQVQTATTDLAGLVALFFRRDGGAPPTGPTPWGGFKLTNLGTPTASTDATTKAYVDGLSSAAAPVGSITMFGGGIAPTGWLICDGASYATATYGALNTVIGTTFGNTGGAGYFNVPDLRGRHAVGAGTGLGAITSTVSSGAISAIVGSLAIATRTVGQWFGHFQHIQTAAEIATHTHEVTSSQPSASVIAGIGGGSFGGMTSFSSNSDGNSANHPITTAAGASSPMDINTPSLVLNFIIKT